VDLSIKNTHPLTLESMKDNNAKNGNRVAPAMTSSQIEEAKQRGNQWLDQYQQ
jgi:hypothetical protein